MFINKGHKNLPNKEHFWMKSEGFGTQEIVVTKDMLKEINNTQYTFSLGIFGVQDSQFSILMVDEFKNVLKVTYQKIANLILKKGEFYYLDYYD